jgi:hypothetical protein
MTAIVRPRECRYDDKEHAPRGRREFSGDEDVQGPGGTHGAI